MEIDATIMKALNTRTRQEIIRLLQRRPYTASELSKILNKHVTTVSEHLEMLEQSGLIHRNEGKKWIYYNLTPKGSGIFNPNRTWSLVLSLSVLSLFAGVLLVQPYGQYAASQELMQATKTIDGASGRVAESINYYSIIGAVLIVMAMLGLVYAAIKYVRVKNTVKIDGIRVNALRKHALFYK